MPLSWVKPVRCISMYVKTLHRNSSSDEKCPRPAVEDIFDNIHTSFQNTSKALCAIHIKAVCCLLRTTPRKWNAILNEELVCKPEQESCDWLDTNHKMTAQSGQPVSEFLSDSLYYILKVFCLDGHRFFQNHLSQITIKEGTKSGRAECRRPMDKSWKNWRVSLSCYVQEDAFTPFPSGVGRLSSGASEPENVSLDRAYSCQAPIRLICEADFNPHSKYRSC